MKTPARATLAILVAPALLLTACGSGGDPATSKASANANAKGQPDVNGDGKVVIGVLSVGDTHDNGYFQSFVDDANTIARSNGWEVRILDKIQVSDAKNQALNLCRQRVDLIAIGSGDLGSALEAAPSPTCNDTHWYLNGGAGQIKQTKYFNQSLDDVNQTLYTAGYAAGLELKERGATKAGFITGPEEDWAKQAVKAFTAGAKKVVPNVEVLSTFSGSFDDAAKNVEAFNAQKAKDIKVVYPYLGGATDAVTKKANEAGIPALSSGTDRCQDKTVAYEISVVFSPGAFFAAALQRFQKGDLKMGEGSRYIIGRDPVPTVKFCNPKDDQAEQIQKLMTDIGSEAFDVDKAVDG
ncbi:BMP family ABC transporter substrate-binding protein [Spongiactinospora sp. TRM90649]|uniref:BMP family ABC transporter substrate-binding protein n=1 Tax=Spongiactinospora sp. TRM90649 TaxID=3031114 RepID=UPI0023F91823|nr:BMP family ABC transporter substrate-binding protein [Spongiactinospora sp. TRM90649]MDF5757550.1 BMP family ABC transporter substrate-binding protein [Spongiactinospora sp. TRM90649]